MPDSQSQQRHVRLFSGEVQSLAAAGDDFFRFDGRPASLVLAFLSPYLDFAATTRVLAEMVGEAPLLALTTSGELHEDPQAPSSLYVPASEGRQSLVLQVFSPDLIAKASLHAVPLHSEDLRAGKATLRASERRALIEEALGDVAPPFPIDVRDTVALIFIDGLSRGENHFMEALYRVGRFPCLCVGGLAGGALDFQHTFVFDGREVREDHAVIVFLKLAAGKRYAVFQSQNFVARDASFIVLKADPNRRVVWTVLDPETFAVLPIHTAIARMVGHDIRNLEYDLPNHALGMVMDGKILIRSLKRIHSETGEAAFLEEVNPGDRLQLLEKVDFVGQTRKDYAAFLKGKPRPVAGILSDCLLRRLNNGASLGDMDGLWGCPVAGWSSFGELLGIVLNNHLVGVFFFEDEKDVPFSDVFLDSFPVHYGWYSSYFTACRLNRIEFLNRLRSESSPYLVDHLAEIEGGAEEIRSIIVQARTEKALRASQKRLDVVASNLFEAILLIDGSGRIAFANPAARHLLGFDDSEEPGDLDAMVKLVVKGEALPFTQAALEQAVVQQSAFTNDDAVFELASGSRISVAYVVSLIREDRDLEGVVISFRSIEALKAAQREAMQASRMASVGQLAAGIAHEINTPIQYIGDNLRFIGNSFSDISSVFEKVFSILKKDSLLPRDLDDLRQSLEKYEIAYLLGELPTATTQSIEGAERVAQIVRSLKEFSHPGSTAKSVADINRAVESTSVVSRNEWKQVAALDLDLDPNLPPIECFPADINQVLLNLIINAAQAVGSVRIEDGAVGRIVVSTRRDGDDIEIRVADDGPGVPPEIRARIFDPFFTTKEVGKGTGQGLSICFDTVVHKHGGALYLDESVESGATFVVRLPIKGRTNGD